MCLPYVAAALPFCVMLVRGYPGGDDWQLELARIAAYRYAWADQQTLPFWAPDLYAGYGSPIFLFYGHVFVALGSALSLWTGSYSLAFVLSLAIASALATHALQLCAAALLPHDRDGSAARVASTLYVTSSYLLCDLLVRSAAAEYMALCLTPLALYGMWRRDGEWRAGVTLAIGLALVVATHLLSALLTTGLLLGLQLGFDRNDYRRRRTVFVAMVSGWALSAYAWLPVLSYAETLRAQDLLFGKFFYAGNFQPTLSLFAGNTPYSAGPLPLIAASLAAVAVLRGAAPARSTAALLTCFAIFVLLQLPGSAPIWKHTPVLPYLQFPWRLMGLLALVAALLGATAFAAFTRSLTGRAGTVSELAVCALCMLAAIPQLARMHSVTDHETDLIERVLQHDAMHTLRVTATARDEYLPPSARWDRVGAPASSALVVGATSGLRIGIRTAAPRHLALDVRATEPSELCLARWAWPTWQLAIDGHAAPITACPAGQLRAAVPPGRHHVTATLEVPRARRWGLFVSSCAAAVVVFGFMLSRRNRTRSPDA